MNKTKDNFMGEIKLHSTKVVSEAIEVIKMDSEETKEANEAIIRTRTPHLLEIVSIINKTMINMEMIVSTTKMTMNTIKMTEIIIRDTKVTIKIA